MRYQDFKLAVYSLVIAEKDWVQYYEMRNKPKKSEQDKVWIKWFRRQMELTQYDVECTHKPTGISIAETVDIVKVKDVVARVKNRIQFERGYRKSNEVEVKNFKGASYSMVGGCFNVPGRINEIAKDPNLNCPMKLKFPRLQTQNYIGVELEFNQKDHRNEMDDIAAGLKAAGVGGYVNLTTDPSCGWEVRCLIPENNWQEILTKILDAIKAMGYTCDQRCGTHVHLDMRRRNVAKVYRNLFFTQTFLRKFLTKERKRNRYCLRNTKDQYDPQEQVRYMGINTQSYTKHQTVEVRMHHGTLEMAELGPWIALLLKIVNFNGEINKKILTLKQAKGILNIEAPLTEQLGGRLSTLFKRKTPEPMDVLGGSSMTNRLNELYRQVYTTMPIFDEAALFSTVVGTEGEL
jgi:hypothetical protein